MDQDKELKIGIAALFSALAMAMDDEGNQLTARLRSKLATLHHSMRDHDCPPTGAMEMLTFADDILHVWANK